HTLPEEQLIQTVEQRYAPGRVTMVQMPRYRNMAQVMSVSKPGKKGDRPAGPFGGMQVLVNPYDGTILGQRTGNSTFQNAIRWLHQVHLRLAAGETGKTIVNFAGLILVLETL